MLEVFNLPAHPLLVHIPVVAIPVFSIIAIVMVVRSKFRSRYAISAIILGVITTISTFLAASSGTALANEFPFLEEEIGTHRQLGETLRLFVLGLTVSVIGIVAAGRRADVNSKDPLSLLVGVAGIAFAVLSLIWVIRTGHAGASRNWNGFF